MIKHTTKELSIIFFSLILAMALSGCTGLGGGTTDDGEPFARTVYTGTDGLVMEFVRDIPQTIYEGSTIDLIVELRNLGTHEIKAARLYLGGYDKSIVPIASSKKIFSLEPKTQYNVGGGFDTVDFRSNIINLPMGNDFYTPKFVLTACYPYQTRATPVVCVDPVPQLGTTDKACQPGSANVGGGQGAPVAVSAVYGESTPGKMRFRIDISNDGDGKVVNIANCPYDLKYTDLNYVDYKISMSGATRADCKPISPVKLVDGDTTIYCTFDVAGKTAYTTPLSITLTYDYMSSVTQDIEIRSLD